MTSYSRTQNLTEVRATVDPTQDQALVHGFEALLAASRPDGMLRTELLRADGDWRIQPWCRDREALSALRAATTEPAAPKLFRAVGAQPELTIMEVRVSPEA